MSEVRTATTASKPLDFMSKWSFFQKGSFLGKILHTQPSDRFMRHSVKILEASDTQLAAHYKTAGVAERFWRLVPQRFTDSMIGKLGTYAKEGNWASKLLAAKDLKTQKLGVKALWFLFPKFTRPAIASSIKFLRGLPLIRNANLSSWVRANAIFGLFTSIIGAGAAAYSAFSKGKGSTADKTMDAATEGGKSLFKNLTEIAASTWVAAALPALLFTSPVGAAGAFVGIIASSIAGSQIRKGLNFLIPDKESASGNPTANLGVPAAGDAMYNPNYASPATPYAWPQAAPQSTASSNPFVAQAPSSMASMPSPGYYDAAFSGNNMGAAVDAAWNNYHQAYAGQSYPFPG